MLDTSKSGTVSGAAWTSGGRTGQLSGVPLQALNDGWSTRGSAGARGV